MKTASSINIFRVYFYNYFAGIDQYRIDATLPEFDNRMGKFCNHASGATGNAQAEYMEVDGRPAIILVAQKDIEPNEEIRYDYGETDHKTRTLFPFLRRKSLIKKL